jgi:hypothetical protein
MYHKFEVQWGFLDFQVSTEWPDVACDYAENLFNTVYIVQLDSDIYHQGDDGGSGRRGFIFGRWVGWRDSFLIIEAVRKGIDGVWYHACQYQHSDTTWRAGN